MCFSNLRNKKELILFYTLILIFLTLNNYFILSDVRHILIKSLEEQT